ncbi:MAG TPA: aldose 1-epimerase family protein [Isosphaeraceae bacterium]|jgi:hypothetical protein|nr:aldose 1-epimerase family protein [Isosphaeraceae bacterium]
MRSITLTDSAHNIWTDAWTIKAADLGHLGMPDWSITKRTFRGGRREGVELIEVYNGALGFSVIPTRGMGIWKVHYRGEPLGWQSPIIDGPVHPTFVNLAGEGGIGWLDGFDELLVRCGLEHNGAPFEEKVTNADGSERHIMHGLHGKIANLPAHFVAVHVSDEPPYEITIEGHVDETRLFGPHFRMMTEIRTVPGSNRLVVRDEFRNLKDSPGELQILYHWNFGPPLLETGSRLVAPIQTVCPRDAHAQQGILRYDVLAQPTPGFAEEVYFFELLGTGPEGRTLTMLRNRAGDKAAVLRFAKEQLPAFTLWKNTGGLQDGYVTGLEPATNYPNPKPFELARHRVLRLEPGASHVAETVLEVLDTSQAVEAAENEILALQGQQRPTVHPKPVEPFAAESS